MFGADISLYSSALSHFLHLSSSVVCASHEKLILLAALHALVRVKGMFFLHEKNNGGRSDPAIEDYLGTWNENPKPFVWMATVASIVEKLARCKQTPEKIQPGCTTYRARKVSKNNSRCFMRHYTE